MSVRPSVSGYLTGEFSCAFTRSVHSDNKMGNLQPKMSSTQKSIIWLLCQLTCRFSILLSILAAQHSLIYCNLCLFLKLTVI